VSGSGEPHSSAAASHYTAYAICTSAAAKGLPAGPKREAAEKEAAELEAAGK
jgi:hypothetical protein